MLPLNLMLQQYKLYFYGLIVALLVGSFGWVIHQRNQARREVAELKLVVEGYKLSAREAKVALSEAVQKADEEGREAAAIVAELTAKLPKDDLEARQWALDAANRINK